MAYRYPPGTKGWYKCPLVMSRPWKHPNSGVYRLRKGVPDDLRALVRKHSLQTLDRPKPNGDMLNHCWSLRRAGPTSALIWWLHIAKERLHAAAGKLMM